MRGAADLFLHEVATIHTQELSTWLGTAHDWSEAWRRGSDMSDFTLRLTPEQAEEMRTRVHEVIESYRAQAPGPDAQDAAQVRVHLHAFPRSNG